MHTTCVWARCKVIINVVDIVKVPGKDSVAYVPTNVVGMKDIEHHTGLTGTLAISERHVLMLEIDIRVIEVEKWVHCGNHKKIHICQMLQVQS